MGSATTENILLEKKDKFGNACIVEEIADEYGKCYTLRIEHENQINDSFLLSKKKAEAIVNILK